MSMGTLVSCTLSVHGLLSAPRTVPLRAAPPVLMARRQYVLGLNQYTHDAGCCLRSTDGEVILTVPKERVSRTKTDAGDTASSVRHALESAGLQPSDVVAVVANNHHHRVLPFEARLPWTVPLGLQPATALEPHNLLPGVPKHELSHHLAHAWSVLDEAPFESGLVVVMDGMGETRQAMDEGAAAAEPTYAHDLQLPQHELGFVELPLERMPGLGYREAESVYAFDRRGGGPASVHRVFKRWVPQRSPPELYNHGFADLESLGALYRPTAP